MKSLTVFSLVLLHEMGKRCGTSTDLDGKTIKVRSKHEGESFLTITLPSFARDFEKSLDAGMVARSRFQGFTWSGGLPLFLGGFLERVFDRGTGRLLENPDIECIRAVRQICLAFGKIELPCSESRVAHAFESYLQCEQELRVSDRELPDSLRESFCRIGRMLWSSVFSAVDLAVYNGDLIPKHGPGSTADKLLGNEKWNQHEWTSRLERYFPFGEWAFPTWCHYLASTAQFLEPGAERAVKVITVPKTLKSPRIIAMEPTCMQYVQQALFRCFSENFRSDDYAREFICSDSQEPNRALAREGSITGALATLDLSEASDRVSNQLVLDLMRNHPHLSGGVQACRSRKADVLGKTIRLAKFASMGSALCFPIEALVFCTIVFVGIEQELKRRLTHGDIQSHVGRVRVYGDDIIVPVEYVSSVVDSLESFGMKVNLGKSFWTGLFRESCGGDYYRGHDVSPVRVRRVFPTSTEHVEEIVSTVALRNNLFEAGFEDSVAWLDELLARVLPVYPEIPRRSPALGRWTHQPVQADAFHRHLHIPLVKACVVDQVLPASPLDGPGALMKWFLKEGDLPFQDRSHLQRAGRPRSARIKTRWVPSVIYGEDGV